MYHVQDSHSHVEDLSACLSRLMIAHHGQGFRENCELVVAFSKTMHSLTILDQLPLLVNLRPGGVAAMNFAVDGELPISTSEDEIRNEMSD